MAQNIKNPMKTRRDPKNSILELLSKNCFTYGNYPNKIYSVEFKKGNNTQDILKFMKMSG